MIDFIKFNETTKFYSDIELFVSKKIIDVSGVSSPKELKNKDNLETIPRTIRINEFTDASLKILAKECDMSINELVNALFDSYVNKHQGQIGGEIMMKECVLNNYLDRIVNELTDMKLESEKRKWLRTIKSEKSQDEHKNPIIRSYCNLIILSPNKKNEMTTFSTIRDININNIKVNGSPIDFSDTGNLVSSQPLEYWLAIPEKKWFTVMSVLSRYFAKCDTLEINRKMDSESLKKMVNIINNSKTNKTIVRNLTKALRHSEKLLGEEKGSIWGIHF